LVESLLKLPGRMVDDFSDQELRELESVAREEFDQNSDEGWTVVEVHRSPSVPGQADLIVQPGDAGGQTVVAIERSEYAGENPANGSHLSDVAFNFSIRLMEFNHIRGFDEFAGKSMATLELYPR
jgi:hypothetical protein